MKKVLPCGAASSVVVAVLLLCSISHVLCHVVHDEHVVAQYESFLAKYDKAYVTGGEEWSRRLDVFATNLALIDSINEDPSSTWTAEVNAFADETFEEFRTHHLFDPQADCSATRTREQNLFSDTDTQ